MADGTPSSISSLPTELIEAIANYLHRHRNSRSNTLFNFSLSSKYIFYIVAPLLVRCIRAVDKPVPLNLTNIFEPYELSFPHSSIPTLGERIANHTRELHQRPKLIVGTDKSSDYRLYFPDFKDLKSLHVEFESRELHRSLFDPIISSYSGLVTLIMDGLLCTDVTCRSLSTLLSTTTCLKVFHLRAFAPPQPEDLIALSDSISNLHQLNEFALSCERRDCNEVFETVLPGMEATPISKLTVSYYEQLNERAEEVLMQVIIRCNLTEHRFEEVELTEMCKYARHSFSLASEILAISTPISINFGPLERHTEDEFLHLREVESFKFQRFRRSRRRRSLNPFLLKSLQESTILRRLEIDVVSMNGFNCLVELLRNTASLDHFCINLKLHLSENASDSFIKALNLCANRRKLTSLQLSPLEFVTVVLKQKVNVSEFILDVDRLEHDIFQKDIFSVIERVFKLGRKVEEKTRMKFYGSRICDYMDFCSKQIMLHLNRRFSRDLNPDMFPNILYFVDGVVLDDVKNSVVEDIMLSCGNELNAMNVKLGFRNGQYCLFI